MAAAPPPPTSPLSAAHLKLLNQALYKYSEAVQAMDKAEAAGIDVSNQRLIQQQALAKTTAIKQTYFPGQP